MTGDDLSPLDDLWLWKGSREGVTAGFTWRGRDGSNDFSLERSDVARSATQRLLKSLRASACVQAEQVHGAQVACLVQGPLRRSLLVPQTDAVVTTIPGVVALVRVADCVPVLLWTPGRIAAAVHAGWRGLAAGVLAATVRELRRLGCNPADLWAAVGPSIGPCCYEVGEEVATRLSALPGGGEAVISTRGRFRVDLAALAISALAALGVPADNIVHVAACTRCRADVLFSYRRDGERAGRQVGAVVLQAGK